MSFKKEDLGKYRLVSCTSILEKVMEQLILETISRQMKDKREIRSNQHRFMKAKSCLTRLIAFCEEMSGLVEEGRAVDVV